MNKISEQIIEVKNKISSRKSKMKENSGSTKERFFHNAICSSEIFGLQLELLELELYLLSVKISFKNGLEKLDSHCNGTCYKSEDVKNMLNHIEI